MATEDSDDDFTNYDDDHDDGKRKILVANIPPGVTEDELEWIFTNKKKQGGGEIESLKMDTNTRSAVIEFKEAGAVDIILKKRPIKIKDNELKVDEYDPWPQIPELNTIRATGLPLQIDRNFLQIYFKTFALSGGDESANVIYNEGETVARVTFETEGVAERVAQRQHIVLDKSIDVTLDTDGDIQENLEEQDAVDATYMEHYRPKVPNRPLLQSLRKELESRKKLAKVGDETNQEPKTNPTHIVVHSVPSEANEEYLQNFFENTNRQGGGPVKSVEIIRDKGMAVVEFEEPGSVNRVLENKQVKIYGNMVEIKSYTPEPQCTVRLTGLPESASEDVLDFYFDNEKKSSGGNVKEIQLGESKSEAYVTFETEEVARRVAERPHTLFGAAIHVQLHRRYDLNGSRSDSQIVKDETNQEPETSPTHIIVHPVPSKANEEYLQMFFENTKRQGGGPVKNVEIVKQEGMAVIEFEEPDSVRTVLKNKDVTICGEQVQIKAYTPEPQCTVHITGLAESASKDFLELYFENEKKSGGGDLKDIQLDETEGEAYVTFETEEVARRVADRTHTLSGDPINVQLYRHLNKSGSRSDECSDVLYSRHSEETITEPVLNPTCIIVHNLPAKANEEFLQMFFENTKKQGGGPVKNVDMDKEEGTAVIEFEETCSASAVLKKKQVKMFDEVVEIKAYSRTPQCTVRITGLAESATKDLLELYFESEKKSGGGNVKEIQLDELEGEAYVTFETEEVARRVADRPHTLSRNHVTVTLHRWHETGKSRRDSENDTTRHVKHNSKVFFRNLPEDVNELEMQTFFEARKNGGGPVKRVEICRSDNTAIVDFKDFKVAERLCSQQVSIKGVSLDVSPYQPPKLKPCYTDRLLLKGVAETTTTEGLNNFIEALSGKAPTKITYGEKDETVMVTFDSEPDFEMFANACKKRSLEGRKLILSKVPISNCVLVSNLKRTTSEDTIRYYFENKKRSGGGDIAKLLLHSEQEYCLVHFLDHSVVDSVLKKQHAVDGRELIVKLYIDDLGVIYNDGTERRFKIPDPISLDDIDNNISEFIMKSEYSQSDITKSLDGLYAQIQLPGEGNIIGIKCTLSADVQGRNKIAKEWHKKVEDAIDQYLNQLSKADHPVGNEILDQVRVHLTDIKIENNEEVILCHDSEHNVIKIAGYKKAVDNLSKKVKEIIQKVCDEADRLKNTAKETLAIFKSWQLQLLKAGGHIQEMKSLFEDLEITIDDDNSFIAFEGKTSDVQSAKDKTYEIVNKTFSEKRIDGITQALTNLFQTGPVRNEIQKRLARKDCVALYETDGTSLVIYSYVKIISICAEIIRETLDERYIQVQKEMKATMSSDRWQSVHQRITDEYGEQCFVEYYEDRLQIVVSGIDDTVSVVQVDIDTFLKDSRIDKEKLPIDNKNIIRLLERHHSDKMEKISQDLREHDVLIWYGSGKITVQGTEKGRELAMKRMNTLCRKVESKRVKLSRVGLVSHMSSQKGKENMHIVEQTYQVVTATMREDYTETGVVSDWSKSKRNVPSIAAAKSSFTTHSRCRMDNGRTLYTGRGNIPMLDVDVIFNSVDQNMSLSGGLGMVLAREGGDTIVKECAAFIKRNGRMRSGDVFVSSAGSLKSKYIVHIASPDWAGGKKREDKVLGETVFKALREANKNNIESVAIPAIGCGNYGFPLQNATEAIARSICNFFREMQDSHIKTVYLLDIKPDTVEAFTCAVEEVFPNVERVRQRSDEEDDEEGNEVERHGESLSFKKTLSSKLDVQRKPGNQKKNTTTNKGKTDIEVVRGELANQQVCVIVNNTSRILNLRYGAVSASILKVGGESVQQELKQKYPNGLNDDEIAVSSGGNMNCRFILHGCLMAWDGGKEALLALRKMVTSCLEEASKLNATSIAFPALGMGQLGYPDDVVARGMFSAADTFICDNPDSPVKDIRFIIYHKDLKAAKTFEAERQNWLASSPTKQRTKPKEGGTQRRRKEESDDDDDVVTIPTQAAAAGAIRITVRQGDITEADICCIVNSSDSSMNLTAGAVSLAISKKCGTAIKLEADAVVTQMQKTGIAMTSAPNLKCKYIMHVDSDRGWKKCVDECLHLAERESIESLAFPALGTAKDLDAKSSAQLMMDSIVEFAKCSDGTLKTIEFVVYDDKMLDDFKAVVKSYKAAKTKQTSMVGAIWKALKETIGMDSKSGQEQTVEDTSTVNIIFYSMSMKSINDAIKGLTKLIDQDVLTQIVEDDCIKTFEKQQITSLHHAAAIKEVELQIIQEKGRISISGISQNVLSFKDDINQLIRKVEKIKYQQKIADIQKDVVQWFYIEVTDTGQELAEYDKQTNSTIEDAFQAQCPNVRWKENKMGTRYIIDFDSMTEFPEEDETDQVKVIRRDLISDMKAATRQWNPPSTWASMESDEFIKVVNLPSSSPEYQKIESIFNKPNTGKSIVQVQRIQNKTLYMQYEAKKQLLEGRNKKGTVNERTLWHGTAPEAVDSINTHGFNRSYCGKNATFHGQGVYFAVNAVYSCRDTYSKEDASGNKRIYLCNVLTGEYTKGDPAMRVPPQKQAGGPHAVYDSVVDDPQNPQMFIIFNDTQAYPDYLVTCKK